MSNGVNGNGNVVVTWWASYIVAPLLVAGVLGVGGWAVALQAGHAQQETQIGVHEQRLDWHERQAEKTDAKLDRILERLEGRS